MNNTTHYQKTKLGICPRTGKNFYSITGPKLHMISSYTSWGYTESTSNYLLKKLEQLPIKNQRIKELHLALKLQDENLQSLAESIAKQKLKEFLFWLKAHPMDDVSQLPELLDIFIKVTK